MMATIRVRVNPAGHGECVIYADAEDSHQPPPAVAHPPFLRPEPRVPHGHGRPHPRRTLPTPPRPSSMITTHRNVRRAAFNTWWPQSYLPS